MPWNFKSTLNYYYHIVLLIIKLTNFLNAHEGSVKDSVVGEECIAQTIFASSFKYSGDSPSLEALKQQEIGRASI